MSNSTTRLRQFLIEVFSDDDLNAFCFDNFPKVQRSFTAGQTKDQRVALLLEHCWQSRKTSDLALALQQTQPDLYYERLGDIDPAEWRELVEQGKRRGCQMSVNIMIGLGLTLILFVAVVGPQNISSMLRPYPIDNTPMIVTVLPALVTPTQLLPVVTSTPRPQVTDRPTVIPSAAPVLTHTLTATPVWLQAEAREDLYIYADPIADKAMGTAVKGTVFFLCAFAADRYLVALDRCHVTPPEGWVDSAYLRPLFKGQFPQALTTPLPTRTPRPWTVTPVPTTP